MPKYRKRPIEIEATQWHRNGDGPADHEGQIVRRFRHPDPAYADDKLHGPDGCGRPWRDHGWIDTLEGGNHGAQVVCPGDWIVTGPRVEHYPVKPHIFAETYEATRHDDGPLVPPALMEAIARQDEQNEKTSRAMALLSEPERTCAEGGDRRPRPAG